MLSDPHNGLTYDASAVPTIPQSDGFRYERIGDREKYNAIPDQYPSGRFAPCKCSRTTVTNLWRATIGHSGSECVTQSWPVAAGSVIPNQAPLPLLNLHHLRTAVRCTPGVPGTRQYRESLLRFRVLTVVRVYRISSPRASDDPRMRRRRRRKRPVRCNPAAGALPSPRRTATGKTAGVSAALLANAFSSRLSPGKESHPQPGCH